MLLFLSTPFLRRLHLIWKPELTAFLIGERNLFFFNPDSLLEVSRIDPETIDSFYRNPQLEGLQLIGFLAPSEISSHPGFAEVNTAGQSDPRQWEASVQLLAPEGPKRHTLKIRISGDTKR